VFFVVGAIYLALVSLASWGLHRLEKQVSIPGFEYVRR
jgi:polar amino acid transport system permease protein